MTFVRSLLLGAALAILPVATAVRAADDHIISLQEADIRDFIDDVAVVTGRTILVDPRVQGNVTISSEQALTDREVFNVFKEVLRVHGYTLVPTAGGEYRVTLLQGSAQDAPLTTGNGVTGQMSTAIIKLREADAAEAARLIKPVMHTQGQVTANPNGRVLVVTDFPENLRKAREIAVAMETSNTTRETIQLRQLSVVDAQEALTALGGPTPPFRIAALPATNSLIIEAAPEELARLRQLLASMDVGSVTPRGAVSVVPLRFANGADLLDMITGLLPSYAREGQAIPAVAYDIGSNTLVISADGETQAELSSLIRRLDVRRPQVLVEALIVEVSEDVSKELGVQFAVGDTSGSTTPLISTNYTRSAPNLLALAGALTGATTDAATRTAAINSLIGLQGGTIGIGGQSGDILFGAILNAVETDEDSNVLSTPFVTTLDNRPATFLVGQEIPIVTGETLGAANVNPFRTFERQEVGIQLDVTPQISDGDVIRLEINQEVSSIDGVLTSAAGNFVTNKRQIETTVLANDGEIIVLGGLLQDDEQIEMSKVPVLGDIPVIGNAFRSRGRSRDKTNLMVFLRPTIIRNADDARPLTERRLNRMRLEDMQQSGRDVSKIDTVPVDPVSPPVAVIPPASVITVPPLPVDPNR
ncbi:type II secretion system secretin GspD [uncultured Algimonas sp.]|uniref:type II secretion system secretin GspD n=1 Tax=uncultured Algimonas sp. TaxID=1547920 RepID=UPI0026294FA6|nr:type II secretion system secretin GspD [uncultured Algimonas sp.]